MNMPAANKATEDRSGAGSILIVVLGSGLSTILPELTSIPKPEAFLVAWTIASLAAYFISPRPDMSLVRWMLERLIFVTSLYLAIFKVPLLLKPSLPTFFAYGIPITICAVGFVLWFRHVRNSARRRT